MGETLSSGFRVCFPASAGVRGSNEIRVTNIRLVNCAMEDRQLYGGGAGLPKTARAENRLEKLRIEFPLGPSLETKFLSEWWTDTLDAGKGLKKQTIEVYQLDEAGNNQKGWRYGKAWICGWGVLPLGKQGSAQRLTEYYSFVCEAVGEIAAKPSVAALAPAVSKAKSGDALLTASSPAAKARVAAAKQAAVDRRYAEMMKDGHGPQRHEGQITEDGLKGRLHGIDPETGTTTDKYTGKKHKCGDNATKVTTVEKYVVAESRVRMNPEFKSRLQKNPNAASMVVPVPLNEALGDDYKSHILGFEKGSLNKTDFTDGRMIAIFEKNSSGRLALKTMYPDPKPKAKK